MRASQGGCSHHSHVLWVMDHYQNDLWHGGPGTCGSCESLSELFSQCCFTCQSFADLVQKLLHSACLCRRLNLWNKNDLKKKKSCWLLRKVLTTTVCDRLKKLTACKLRCCVCQTSDWSKYLLPITLLDSMPHQSVTAAFECYKGC